MVKIIMPKAQTSDIIRSERDAPFVSLSVTRSSGAMYTTVPRSVVVVLEDTTARVWIKRERLSPKSVSLQAMGLKSNFCWNSKESTGNELYC